MNTSPNVTQTDPSIIVDKKSGKQFRRFKYFDIEVIQDVETGWINAGKFIKEIGKIEGKNIKMEHFKTTKDFQLCIEYMKAQGGTENSPTLNDEISYKLANGYGNDVKGSYTVFRVFQIIALWADKKHKIAILELLEQINTIADLMNVSTYEVLEREKKVLEEEAEILRKQQETNIKYLNSYREELLIRSEIIEEQKIQIEEQAKKLEDFNKPYNQDNHPTIIYALKVNENYFQLKYRANPSNQLGFHRVAMINAEKVKDEAKHELKQMKLMRSIGGKNLIPMDQLNFTFQLIDKIKNNTRIELPSTDERNNFINEKLEKYKSMRKTPNVEGLIYEYETILKNPTFIPWKCLPIDLLYKNGEQRLDNGIDAVEFNQNKSIKRIVQIKYHRGGYLRREEIQTFINKCQSGRYNDCEKLLIVHGCKISAKLRKEIEEIGIQIDTPI